MERYRRLVRESIPQFKRGGDPKDRMQVGTYAQIEKWINDTHGDVHPDEWIWFITTDNDMDYYQKRDWTEALIKKGHKWNDDSTEFVFQEFDENILDHWPKGTTDYLDLTLIKKPDGKFEVKFSDWDNWSDSLFHGEDAQRYASDIINGFGYKHFDQYYPYQMSDISDFLDDHANEINIDYLKDTYDYLGGDEEARDDIYEMIQEIWENPKLDALKTTLQSAMNSAHNNALEGEAFKNILKIIRDEMDIGEEKYHDETNFKYYTVPISKEGVWKLMGMVSGDKERINFVEKDLMVEADPETFSEDLNVNLEQIR